MTDTKPARARHAPPPQEVKMASKHVPPPLSRESEARLVRVLNDVADATADDTQDPSVAIAKAAAAHNLPAGHVDLAVWAYNNGRAAGQLAADDRGAAFPVADAAKVRQTMYGGEKVAEDTRVHPRWTTAPAESDAERRARLRGRLSAFTKAAGAAPAPAENVEAAEDLARRRMRGDEQRAKRAYDERRRQVAALRDAAGDAFLAVADALRGCTPAHYAHVKYAAAVRGGAEGERLFECLERARPALGDCAKKAAFDARTSRGPALGGAFALAYAAVEKAAAYKAARDRLAAEAAEVAGRAEALTEIATGDIRLSASGVPLKGEEPVKVAFGDPAAGGVGGGLGGAYLGNMGADKLLGKADREADDDEDGKEKKASDDDEGDGGKRKGPALGAAFAKGYGAGRKLPGFSAVKSLASLGGKYQEQRTAAKTKAYGDLLAKRYSTEAPSGAAAHLDRLDEVASLQDVVSSPRFANHDPREVLGIYRKLVGVAPTAMRNPAIASDFVARHLEGGPLSYFDLKALGEIDYNLVATRNERDGAGSSKTK